MTDARNYQQATEVGISPSAGAQVAEEIVEVGVQGITGDARVAQEIVEVGVSTAPEVNWVRVPNEQVEVGVVPSPGARVHQFFNEVLMGPPVAGPLPVPHPAPLPPEFYSKNSHWLSKPNPSQFAIENLYFDVSEAGGAVVVDRVIIDPITPNLYCNIYYSNEGSPETEAADWDDKLWTRVPQIYHITHRESYALPEPVSAKYIKLEFTNLQARPYQPGPWQQAVNYIKHPKWVLDFFLLRTAQDRDTEDFFITNQTLRHDALDVAYKYYLDDLHQDPDTPAQIINEADVQKFLLTRNDVSDVVDPQTLNQISLVLDRFRRTPLGDMTFTNLLGDYVAAVLDRSIVTEETPAGPDVSLNVSSLNRDRLVYEQSFPIMFYYLTCRHRYRHVSADFEHNRAYFAGIREIAFLRNRYGVAYDGDFYIESGQDGVNLARNDFI